MNEEDTFFLLENIAKKEHSGLPVAWEWEQEP